jgi:hypothetical protein
VASFIGNGKGFNIPGAVLAMPAAGPGSPVEYRLQPNRWSIAKLALLKANGFGMIRLVSTPVPLMTNDPKALDRAIDWLYTMVQQANAEGLGVIVDMHFWSSDVPLSQDTVPNDPAKRPALMRGEKALAARLATIPGHRVALEIMNEPYCQKPGLPNDWSVVQREFVTQIRAVAPHLPLVLTGCRGRIDTLISLDASPYRGDPNLYWTFHYYDFFGSQDSNGLDGVPFPPDPALGQSLATMKPMIPLTTLATNPHIVRQLRDYLLNHHGRATIRAQMESVTAWARRYSISPRHIFMGEFAALLTNNPANENIRPDNLRWTTAVRQEAERQGFFWAHWGTSVNYDPVTKFYRKDAETALGVGGAP